jgi:hypothetical protein
VVSIRKEHKLHVFENKTLSGIFQLEKDEVVVSEQCKIVHKEEIHGFCSSNHGWPLCILRLELGIS